MVIVKAGKNMYILYTFSEVPRFSHFKYYVLGIKYYITIAFKDSAIAGMVQSFCGFVHCQSRRLQHVFCIHFLKFLLIADPCV